jgi:sugar (pentulose or hexulose) kinase
MNRRAPDVHGTIKLHKQQKPLCPIVSWKDSPGYKLAKYITAQLSNILQLPNNYNIQNSSNQIHSLKYMEVDKNTKLSSFDIENIH